MENTKHTPGPWKTNEAQTIVLVSTPFGNDVVCHMTDSGHTKEVTEANARLISIAPEMLEALEQICKDCVTILPEFETASSFVKAQSLLSRINK